MGVASTAPTTTTTTTTTTTPVPLDWKTYAGAEWAEVVADSPVTWAGASTVCQLHGGNLASITSWDIQVRVGGRPYLQYS